VVPEIINSRTMLPLRFVSENLGCSVLWEDATKTITITYEL
jgi:minor extracellular serine protease Vpr